MSDQISASRSLSASHHNVHDLAPSSAKAHRRRKRKNRVAHPRPRSTAFTTHTPGLPPFTALGSPSPRLRGWPTELSVHSSGTPRRAGTCPVGDIAQRRLVPPVAQSGSWACGCESFRDKTLALITDGTSERDVYNMAKRPPVGTLVSWYSFTSLFPFSRYSVLPRTPFSSRRMPIATVDHHSRGATLSKSSSWPAASMGTRTPSSVRNTLALRLTWSDGNSSPSTGPCLP